MTGEALYLRAEGGDGGSDNDKGVASPTVRRSITSTAVASVSSPRRARQERTRGGAEVFRRARLQVASTAAVASAASPKADAAPAAMQGASKPAIRLKRGGGGGATKSATAAAAVAEVETQEAPKRQPPARRSAKPAIRTARLARAKAPSKPPIRTKRARQASGEGGGGAGAGADASGGKGDEAELRAKALRALALASLGGRSKRQKV